MKRVKSVITMLILFLGTGYAAENVSDRESDHQALRALRTQVVEAINGKDMDKLGTLFTKEFVFTTVTQEALTSAQAVKDYYNKMMVAETSPVTDIQIAPEADILTKFLSDSAGYCYGNSDDSYVLRRNGRTVVMKSRWTALVVKEEGSWKICAVHLGCDIMNNPVLETASLSTWRKMLLAMGIGKYPGEK